MPSPIADFCRAKTADAQRRRPFHHRLTERTWRGKPRLDFQRAIRVDHVLTAHFSLNSANKKALENINVFKGLEWLRG